MKNRKIVQLETPHAQQVGLNHAQRRRVHIHRCERIIACFAVLFVILGFQILSSRRTLTKVNANIQQTQSELASQKEQGRELNQQIKQLHDPDYVQQVIRSKYDYSKKGETVYNLNN